MGKGAIPEDHSAASDPSGDRCLPGTADHRRRGALRRHELGAETTAPVRAAVSRASHQIDADASGSARRTRRSAGRRCRCHAEGATGTSAGRLRKQTPTRRAARREVRERIVPASDAASSQLEGRRVAGREAAFGVATVRRALLGTCDHSNGIVARSNPAVYDGLDAGSRRGRAIRRGPRGRAARRFGCLFS